MYPRSPRLEAAREQLRGLEADGVGRLRRLASDAEERAGGGNPDPNPYPNPYSSPDRSPSPRRALLDSGSVNGGLHGGQLFNVDLSSSERDSPAARAAAIFAAQAERVRALSVDRFTLADLQSLCTERCMQAFWCLSHDLQPKS